MLRLYFYLKIKIIVSLLTQQGFWSSKIDTEIVAYRSYITGYALAVQVSDIIHVDISFVGIFNTIRQLSIFLHLCFLKEFAMMSENEAKITQKKIIPFELEHVWAFLLNEEKMKHWFNADKFLIDAIEGGEIRIPISFQEEEWLVVGEMGLILPKSKFVFTWMERDKLGDRWFNNTILTINLEEVESGTQLSLVHDGFKYLPEDIQEEVHQKYINYWQESKIMERLLDLLSAAI